MSTGMAASGGLMEGVTAFTSSFSGTLQLPKMRSAAVASAGYSENTSKKGSELESGNVYARMKAISGVESAGYTFIMSVPGGGVTQIIDALDLSIVREVYFDESAEEIEMASNTLSRMDIFVSQTLPVLVVVIGAAWVMYTRLDDGISDARLETKQDFKGVNELIESRFNRSEAKIDALDTKLDQKLSSVLQQVTDLRIRQTQSETKQ